MVLAVLLVLVLPLTVGALGYPSSIGGGGGKGIGPHSSPDQLAPEPLTSPSISNDPGGGDTHTAIPEPGTLALVALGLIGAGVVYKFRS